MTHNRAAQIRCGKRGHWQAVDSETGEVFAAECIYCGSKAYGATGLTRSMFATVAVCLAVWVSIALSSGLWLIGVVK